MRCFQQFYTAKKNTQLPEKISSEEIESLFPAWVDELRESISKLYHRGILPGAAAKIGNDLLTQWQDYPRKGMITEITTSWIDMLYQRVIAYVMDQITVNPTRLTIPQSYPFAASVSGVKIQVRIIEQDDQHGSQMRYFDTESSAVGSGARAASQSSKEISHAFN